MPFPYRVVVNCDFQVIHQDENWGDNTTAITGNTSETGFSMTMDSMPKFNFGKQATPGVGFNLTRFLGVALAILLSLFGFLSPIAMVILPRFDLVDWNPVPDGVLGREEMAERVRRCAPECEGVLISFSFKLLILLLGTLAVFFRQPRSSLPRVYVYRAVVLFLVFLLTAAFWLFYGVRIMRDRMADYHGIVRYADSLVNGLLFVHYLALVLLELRQLQPRFVVRVTRSPDGEVRSYSLGVLSVQRAAVSILEHYYRDFPTYNPYLDLIGRRGVRQNLTGLKVYDVDGAGPGQAIEPGRPQVVFAAAARGRDGSHNDRFYHEQEYERRARKRRARLQVTAEEAFTHVKRLQDEKGGFFCQDALLFLSGRATFSARMRYFFYQDALLFLSGCAAFSVGVRCFFCRGALLFLSGCAAFSVGVRCFFCRGAPLFLSGCAAFSVGVRRFFCRGAPLFLSGCAAFSVGVRCFFCRGPPLFLSGCAAFSVGVRHFFCHGALLSLPGYVLFLLWSATFLSGCATFSVGVRYFLYQGSLLFISGFATFSVGVRYFFCQGALLFYQGALLHLLGCATFSVVMHYFLYQGVLLFLPGCSTFYVGVCFFFCRDA